MRSVAWSSVVVVAAVLGSIACPGRGQSAGMVYPLAVAVGGDTVYVADLNRPGIWAIAPGGTEIFFAASNKFRAPLNRPRCLAVGADGKLLVGDTATREVYRFDEPGKPTPLTGGKIGMPMGLAVTKSGSIVVSDLETQRVYEIPAAGGEPKERAAIVGPRGVAVDAQDRIWVVSGGKDAVVRILPDGTIETAVAGRPFGFANHLALDPQGVLYVDDNYGACVWRVGAEGPPVKWASGAPLVRPVGLAWRGDKLLVSDPVAKSVFQLDAEGKAAPYQP
jgi:DNA-binding beta-propeller fold protein YncE